MDIPIVVAGNAGVLGAARLAIIAARHLGMRVLVLSLAANPAAGLVDRPLTHTEVLEEGEKAAKKLAKLIGLLVSKAF